MTRAKKNKRIVGSTKNHDRLKRSGGPEVAGRNQRKFCPTGPAKFPTGPGRRRISKTKTAMPGPVQAFLYQSRRKQKPEGINRLKPDQSDYSWTGRARSAEHLMHGAARQLWRTLCLLYSPIFFLYK
ncbi:Ubiquitin carboxyl-terminal hydrolase [Actinidia chinensis var. chinensis]|uniref:Ubiquitin carboxyl-terminal hydrolase n=1 Tax=Actinidia chinensis var. chinensis TaxID=1590841 RepID=A0A2R6S1S3_ACTCC|nr:Ubiquitin carboxyl-terminal hydrolase [Actinidia chinensis var. chinensis]